MNINSCVYGQKWQVWYQNIAAQEHGQAYSSTSGFNFWLLAKINVKNEDNGDKSKHQNEDYADKSEAQCPIEVTVGLH